ncbi:unnamed protein product [Polarella glacialis]|uniref:Copper type II ascorbate-dependent monooxygenase N-terminal domain-containing protein n=1 Tax=Polarella glacialis TaxID=89957 RepID=A0A813D6B8_POLGL|nr:unnamed protein product [Polarella glacialis]CAE8699363.1 unnamed protein product [Polarella glacialis]
MGTTTYYPVCFNVSSVTASHIIAFEPIIEPAFMQPQVHHFAVIASTKSSDCFGLGDALIWAWAAGVPGLAFPAEAGLLVGGNNPESFQSILVAIHYDSPDRLSLLDNSGIRIFKSKTLSRQQRSCHATG